MFLHKDINKEDLIMNQYMDDVTPYRKRANKKKIKKSDHKHEYELVEVQPWSIKNWFTHIEVCKICGKERNQLRIEK